MNEPRSKDKPFAIPKQAVVEAFRKVKANQGGPGVDGCTIEDIEADLRNTLYVTWNRMSSGSYFPPPVKLVEVPKPHGRGVRRLGVPTVAECPFRGGLLPAGFYAASRSLAGSGGSQGLPARAVLTALRAVRPWAVAESR